MHRKRCEIYFSCWSPSCIHFSINYKNNEHKPGNMAVLVSAPTTGLRTLEDVIEARQNRGA